MTMVEGFWQYGFSEIVLIKAFTGHFTPKI